MIEKVTDSIIPNVKTEGEEADSTGKRPRKIVTKSQKAAPKR